MNKIFTYAFTKKQFLLGLLTLLSIVRVFAQAPVISSFSPATGPVGTTVTITGTGFAPATANNVVFFGATKATVTAASTTSLTVTVPVGASYQPISVLNGNTTLTGYSEIPFITTFTPNKGDITLADFMPPVNFRTGTRPADVAISDIDGDGKPDLIVTNFFDNTISVLRNISVSGAITSGSFAPKVDLATGKHPGALVVSDLDGDGKPDVAVVNGLDSTISIFRNTSIAGSISTGSFAAPVTLPTGPHPFALRVGDIDGDGKPDLVVISSVYTDQYNENTYTNTISVLRNTSVSGSITVGSFAPGVPIFAGHGDAEEDLTIGDLDGDGKPELAISLYNHGQVAVFRNTSTTGSINGVGSFAAPVYLNSTGGAFSLTMGDLDGDGKSDLVVTSIGQFVSIFRNTSISGSITTSSFAAPIVLSVPYQTLGFSTIGDLDGDGKPDIAVVGYTDNQNISVFRNISTLGSITAGSFASRVDLPVGVGLNNIKICDLDGDGKPDLIAGVESYFNDPSLAILRNAPFFPPTVQATNVTFSNTDRNSTTASWVNGNGKARAVFMSLGSTGSPSPVNRTDYTENTVFTQGAQIGNNGWYCVYNGTGNLVNITGLSSGSTYRVMVVEYNGDTGSENYLTTISTGNPANVTTVAGGAVAIDSINRVTAALTNAATVQYKAIFIAPITGLTAGDFALSTTGNISSASITSLTGSGSNYIITVNTGTGNGTIGLNLAGATGILPGIISPLPFKGQVYAFDRTPPSITISNPSDSLILSGTSKKVTYKVTYADSNFKASALSASDIILNRTGSATGTVSVSGSDTTYTVAISNITGSGSLGISIGAGTASDLAGNTAPMAGPSKSFLISPVLSGLTTSSGTLSPVFADTTMNYTATVNNGVNIITITPILTDPNATVTVNGAGPSTPVNLVVGYNNITVKVTTLNGNDTTTYTIGVMRAGQGPNITYGTATATVKSGVPVSLHLTNTGGAVDATVYGQVSTLAGSTTDAPGYVNAADTSALFNYPQSMIKDAFGNLYIADSNNNAVRMMSPSGMITTFAGSATGLGGNADGMGTSALFSFPDGIAIDAAGNLFVADYGNNAIRKIAPDGMVSTFYSGTDTFGPGGICFDSSGNLIVTAQNSSQILKITPAGVATTIAGNTAGYANGSGTSALFNMEDDVRADTLGNLYVADFLNNAIRKISPTGVVTTFAGSDVSGNAAGYADGVGTAAIFNEPSGLAIGPGRVIYVADIYNNDIRKIAPDGTVTLVAGNSSQVQGNADGKGTAASFNLPGSIYIDDNGIGYISEIGGSRVRKIMLTGYTINGTLPPGLTFDATTGNISGTVTVPFTTRTDTVSAYNGFGHSSTTITFSYYTPSTIATLANLIPSSGTLNPAFTSPVIVYTDTVTYATSSITVTPTATDSTATIKVNGAVVASGIASASIPLAIGPNTITIVVTAQDGITTDTYTLTVTRLLGSDATLADLTLSSGTLSPTFAGGTTSYTAGVSNATTNLNVTPTTNDNNATVTVNGIGVASGTASGAIPLAVGPNTITTVVTAQDGTTTDTYTVIVTRLPSSVATLDNLTVSQGALSPFFASGRTSYTDAVSNTTTSITVTPTFTDSTSTITVSGTAVTSGTPSAAIPLAIGPNTITTVVTAQDGTTTDTYTVVVTRAPSSVATLDNLTVSQGALSPAFVSGTTSYTDAVSNGTASITVTPTFTDSTATITVNSTAVISGTASASIPLAVGPNTITTLVTAQDRATTDTYTVIVTRAANSDASLINLTVSQGTLTPAFSSGTFAYTDNVPNSTTSITVTPTTSDNTATVKVNGISVASGTPSGSIPLAVGANTITTVVTAQDGTTVDTYTVIVTRAPSSDATETNLTVSEGTLSPAFNSGITAYTDTVSNLISSLTVTATTSDQNATVTVNGTTIANGSPSGAILLTAGANTITVTITAQDGTTTNTYTITVYRGESMGSIDATNVLTPNGDGRNDYWLIKDIGLYPQNNVKVFDKAGRLVYAKYGYNNEWDGTLNGRPLAEGTYYFVVDLGPNLRKFKGYVSILRN